MPYPYLDRKEHNHIQHFKTKNEKIGSTLCKNY